MLLRAGVDDEGSEEPCGIRGRAGFELPELGLRKNLAGVDVGSWFDGMDLSGSVWAVEVLDEVVVGLE